MSLKCVKVDKNWKWFVENGKIALRINDGYKFYSAYRESQIDRALSKPFEFSADDSMYFYHFRECLSDHPYDFLEHHQVALNALTAEHFIHTAQDLSSVLVKRNESGSRFKAGSIVRGSLTGAYSGTVEFIVLRAETDGKLACMVIGGNYAGLSFCPKFAVYFVDQDRLYSAAVGSEFMDILANDR